MKTLIKHEPEVLEDVRLNGNYAPGKPAKAPGKVRVAWVLTIVAGLGFFAAGGYTAFRGVDAKDKVVAEFKAQKIVTPEDASIPNAPVVNAATAQAQADVIWKHMMDATGGKTYSQLARTDPARVTAFNGSMLRTSLLSGVLAWNVADLVIGIGAFFAAAGLLLLVGAFLIRPGRPQAA